MRDEGNSIKGSAHDIRQAIVTESLGLGFQWQIVREISGNVILRNVPELFICRSLTGSSFSGRTNCKGKGTESTQHQFQPLSVKTAINVSWLRQHPPPLISKMTLHTGPCPTCQTECRWPGPQLHHHLSKAWIISRPEDILTTRQCLNFWKISRKNLCHLCLIDQESGHHLCWKLTKSML